MKPQWQLLTFPSTEDMTQVREQCHQAIQNVAAVGRSFLPKSAEDENANLEWDAGLERLVGRWVETGEVTFRSSLSISDFTVFLVNSNIETISSFSLQGKTQTDVMVWLEHQLDELGFEFSKINLALPYKIPEYPTAKGKAFQIDNLEAASELSRLYHNTKLLLTDLLSKYDETTSVKCWPHHFDIAGRIILLNTGDPATTKSIGLGLSPGDKYYNEPYFYVSPWPYPTKDLPELESSYGHWHEDDWIGAVLQVSDLSALDLIQDQRRAVQNFFQEVTDILLESA